MKLLVDVVRNPSGFDSMSNYCGKIPDTKWLVLMTRNRDSATLTNSNWECALELLGGEQENHVEIFRFGHWACGWWEALCVAADSSAADEATAIEAKLDSYPILDENHFSEAEQDEANQVWQDCYSVSDRIDYVRSHRSQFEFTSFSDLMNCIRGHYFAGYASELVN
jgi:hypothetical protein